MTAHHIGRASVRHGASRHLVPRRAQRGSTILLVLILLGVMLLGALAMSRLAEVSTLAGGNAASSDGAMQASEVGVNTGFAAARALADEDVAIAGWYWPTMQAADATGVPQVSWSAAPELTVGLFRVKYVVERMCTSTPVTDATRQCLVRQVLKTESNSQLSERPDPPTARQFRITVQVTGPKGAHTWTQALVTRGT